MARVTAPLFGLAASGTIAEALTYARWKGIQYVRTRVVPNNPQSAAQVAIRNIFRNMSELWKRMPAGARVPWEYAVRGRPMTDRNRHVQANVGVLQGEGDLDLLVMSVSSGGAVAPATMTPSDAGGQVLTIAATAPTIPAGYSLEWIEMACVIDGDPEELITRTVLWDQDDAVPYTVDFAVGVAGNYQCAAWCHMASRGVYYCSEALRAVQAIA